LKIQVRYDNDPQWEDWSLRGKRRILECDSGKIWGGSQIPPPPVIMLDSNGSMISSIKGTEYSPKHGMVYGTSKGELAGMAGRFPATFEACPPLASTAATDRSGSTLSSRSTEREESTVAVMELDGPTIGKCGETMRRELDDEPSKRASTELEKWVCTVQCAESCRCAVEPQPNILILQTGRGADVAEEDGLGTREDQTTDNGVRKNKK
jgi:hypothetical protein